MQLLKELIEEEDGGKETNMDGSVRERINTNESDFSELSDEIENDEEEYSKSYKLKLAEIRHDLGTVARLEGDLETSAASLKLSVELKTEIMGGHSRTVAESLSSLSLTMKLLGREEEAEEFNRKAMRTFHDIETNHVLLGWF